MEESFVTTRLQQQPSLLKGELRYY
jgi:SWI/SNF-related matrix-associated actin-dependent regulator of chromatin subfamily A member 5